MLVKNPGKALETPQQKKPAVDKKCSIPPTRSRSVLSFLSKKKSAPSKKDDDGETDSTQSLESDSNTTTTDPVSHVATAISKKTLVEQVSSVPKPPVLERDSSSSNGPSFEMFSSDLKPTLAEKVSADSKPTLAEKDFFISKAPIKEKTSFAHEEMQANEYLEIEICLSRGDDTVVSVFSQSMTKPFPGSPISEVKEQEKVEKEYGDHPFLENPADMAVVKEAEEQLFVDAPGEQSRFQESLIQEQQEVLVVGSEEEDVPQENEDHVVPKKEEEEEDHVSVKQENELVTQKQEDESVVTQEQEEEDAQKKDLVIEKQEDQSIVQNKEEQQGIEKLAESRNVQKAIVYQVVKKVFSDADTDFISVASNQAGHPALKTVISDADTASIKSAVKTVILNADTASIRSAVKTALSDADTASIKLLNKSGKAKQEPQREHKMNCNQTMCSETQPFEDLLGPIKITKIDKTDAMMMVEVFTAMASLFGHAFQDAFEECRMYKHDVNRDDILLYSDDDDNTSAFSESSLGDNSLCADSQSQEDVEGLVMRVMAKIMANSTLRAKVPEIDHLHDCVKDAICDAESRDDVERVTRDIVSSIIMDRDDRLESLTVDTERMHGATRRMRDKKSEKAERLIENYDNAIAQMTGNQPAVSSQKNHKASKSVCTVTTQKRSLAGVKSLLSRQHKYKDSVARFNPRKSRGTLSSSHRRRKTAD